MAYAAATERVRLGTGVLPIYSRTPRRDRPAGGDRSTSTRRAGWSLGLGVSHQVTVENWYGDRDGEARSRRCASTSAIVRAAFRGEDPPEGEIFTTQLPLHGLRAAARTCRSTSPRCRRTCCELAGEIADGVMLWLCNPEYIRDVVVPEVRAGRERAGKSWMASTSSRPCRPR